MDKILEENKDTINKHNKVIEKRINKFEKVMKEIEKIVESMSEEVKALLVGYYLNIGHPKNKKDIDELNITTDQIINIIKEYEEVRLEKVIEYLEKVAIREYLFDIEKIEDEDDEMIEVVQEEIKENNSRGIINKVLFPWAGLSVLERVDRVAIDTSYKAKELIVNELLEEVDIKEINDKVQELLNRSVSTSRSLLISEETRLVNEVMIEKVSGEIDEEIMKEMEFLQSIDYREYFEEDKEVELMYNATFDNSCDECVSSHGVVFTHENYIPLPQHVNCACFYTPLYK